MGKSYFPITQKQTQSTVIDFKYHLLRYIQQNNSSKHHTSVVHQDKLILGEMGWAVALLVHRQARTQTQATCLYQKR